MLPINVYERAGQATFNTVVMIDADGTALGTYRKSHIPDGPGYTEKYYFNPGDTGFRAWATAPRRGRHRHLLGPVVPRGRPLHGAGRCRGAALPHRDRQRAARPRPGTRAATGSARCRATPPPTSCRWWPPTATASSTAPRPRASRTGRSPSTDRRSSPTTPAPRWPRRRRDADAVLTATFDLDDLAVQRTAWGLFRDRRPDLYGPILTLDGTSNPRAQPHERSPLMGRLRMPAEFDRPRRHGDRLAVPGRDLPRCADGRGPRRPRRAGPGHQPATSRCG